MHLHVFDQQVSPADSILIYKAYCIADLSLLHNYMICAFSPCIILPCLWFHFMIYDVNSLLYIDYQARLSEECPSSMTIMHPACNEVIHPLADFTCQSTLQQQENSSRLLYDWSTALRSRPLVQSLRFVNETSWRWREFYIYCVLGRREIELYLSQCKYVTFLHLFFWRVSA